MNENAELGNLTDKLVRNALRVFLQESSRTEGSGQAIQINRNVYDPEGSGDHVRPDLYRRDEGVIIDGTIGVPRPITAPQMQGYIDYADPGNLLKPGTEIGPDDDV